MRVMLIRPNSVTGSVTVPLGLGYLSHAVKEARGDQTQVIDGRKGRLSDEAIVARALSFAPDVVGVTGTTIDAPGAFGLISRFKQEKPNIPVILGGAHATAYGPVLLDKIDADYMVIGEGEDTLVELLDALEGKRELGTVKGLVGRVDGNSFFAGPREPIEDVDRLKVDWESIHPEKYMGRWANNGMHNIAHSGRRLPIFTSRGCPMGCAYCHNLFGRKFRVFDTKKTVDEMIMLRDRYRLREFEIMEDFFNCNLDRAKGFLQEVIDRKLNCAIAFTNGLRADRMDEELLDLMVRAGTYRIYYAIESANERIQKLVHKNLNLERAREVVNMTAARGILTGTYNIMGFPGETEEEIDRTIDYAVSLKNHTAHFFILNPFPGTELAEADPEVSRKVREASFGNYGRVAVNLSKVPASLLEKKFITAYRRFYLSPQRIFRLTKDVPKNLRLSYAVVGLFRGVSIGVKGNE